MKSIIKDKFILFPFIVSLFLLIVLLVVVYFNLKGMSNILVIHFDAFKGVDFFGTKTAIFNILGLEAVIIILNIFLSRELYLKERFLSYLLSVFTVVFSLLIFIGVFAIISVN